MSPQYCAPPPLDCGMHHGVQGYETSLQLALHNGHVIVATHPQHPHAPVPADAVDGPGWAHSCNSRPCSCPAGRNIFAAMLSHPSIWSALPAAARAIQLAAVLCSLASCPWAQCACASCCPGCPPPAVLCPRSRRKRVMPRWSTWSWTWQTLSESRCKLWASHWPGSTCKTIHGLEPLACRAWVLLEPGY